MVTGVSVSGLVADTRPAQSTRLRPRRNPAAVRGPRAWPRGLRGDPGGDGMLGMIPAPAGSQRLVGDGRPARRGWRRPLWRSCAQRRTPGCGAPGGWGRLVGDAAQAGLWCAPQHEVEADGLLRWRRAKWRRRRPRQPNQRRTAFECYAGPSPSRAAPRRGRGSPPGGPQRRSSEARPSSAPRRTRHSERRGSRAGHNTRPLPSRRTEAGAAGRGERGLARKGQGWPAESRGCPDGQPP